MALLCAIHSIMFADQKDRAFLRLHLITPPKRSPEKLQKNESALPIKPITQERRNITYRFSNVQALLNSNSGLKTGGKYLFINIT